MLTPGRVEAYRDPLVPVSSRNCALDLVHRFAGGTRMRLSVNLCRSPSLERRSGSAGRRHPSLGDPAWNLRPRPRPGRRRLPVGGRRRRAARAIRVPRREWLGQRPDDGAGGRTRRHADQAARPRTQPCPLKPAYAQVRGDHQRDSDPDRTRRVWGRRDAAQRSAARP